MASYARVMDMRELLPQVPAGAEQDARLQTCLDRATAMAEAETGVPFAAHGAVATDKDFCVRLYDAQYLTLPAYLAGSITHVYELDAKGSPSESTTEIAATEYDVLDDGEGTTGGRLYRYDGWRSGWYRVTAIWGYGEAPLELVQVVLEKAVNLWLGAQGGQFSDVVGIEGGGAVGYNRAWTNAQRAVIDAVRLRYGQYGFA